MFPYSLLMLVASLLYKDKIIIMIMNKHYSIDARAAGGKWDAEEWTTLPPSVGNGKCTKITSHTSGSSWRGEPLKVLGYSVGCGYWLEYLFGNFSKNVNTQVAGGDMGRSVVYVNKTEVKPRRCVLVSTRSRLTQTQCSTRNRREDFRA